MIQIKDSFEGISYILTTPNKKTSSPCVLMLHGFASNKDEVGGFYKKLSKKLASIGIASLRFDFQGCGESKGNLTTLTIESQIDNTIKMFDYLTTRAEINEKCIGICGFSLGAAVAVLSATKLRSIQLMILLSPALNLKKDFEKFLGDLGTKIFYKLKSTTDTSEQVLIQFDWRENVYLSLNFFKELVETNTTEQFANYNGAIFTIASENDFTSKNAKRYFDIAKTTEKKIKLIPNSDHIFGVFKTGEANKSKEVIDLITQECKNRLNRIAKK